MSGVWKAPWVLRTLACNAPAFSLRSLRVRMVGSVPAQEKPLGKSSFAIRQMAFLPSVLAASWQSCSSLPFSRPATESMACLPTFAASSMASPRIFTSLRPSSKLKTLAAHSAVYSPRERPAVAVNRVASAGFSTFSFSSPARPAMYMAGWHLEVSSSFDSGPLRQSSRTSQPRISLALLSMVLTAGMSLTPVIIFMYCEPWPGKSSPTGSGGSAGVSATAGLAATASSGSSSSSGSGSGPVPYFIGSKPHTSAAPGRLEKKPFEGFLFHWKPP
mmetsp:Transcript_147189/g.410017  ORF Transcript_147189/g.410017 Transcript_147189/m.410017 type:complete len:274 (-) Transcript_147189:583-1404(-)